MSTATVLTSIPATTDARRIFIRNSAVTVIAQCALILLQIVSVPYIANRLGTARYGALLILMTYLEMFSVLNLGLNTALVKRLSELIPLGEIQEASSFLSACLAFCALSGIAVAGVTAICAGPIVSLFLSQSPDLAVAMVPALRFASAAFFFRFITQVFSAVPIAIQRSDLATSITVITELARVSLSLVVLNVIASIQAIMAVTLFASVASAIGFFLLVLRLSPELCIFSSFQRKHFRELMGFSGFVIVTNVSSRIVSSVDQFLIAYRLPVENIAFYSVPYGIGQRIWTVVGNVAGSMFPLASALSACGRNAELKHVYLRSLRITTALAAFPMVFLIAYRSEILSLWLGPEFSLRSSYPLAILLAAFLANCAGLVPFFVLQSHKPSTTSWIAILYAVINCAGFAIAIPAYGLLGAAYAFLLSQVLTFPVLLKQANKCVSLQFAEVIEAYMPALIAPALAVGATLPYTTGSLAAILSAGAAASILFLLLCWSWLLTAEDRRQCRSLVRSRIAI